MPEVKEIKLSKIIDFSISANSKLTKLFIHNHKGDVPVYGSSKNPNEASYGYVEDNLDGITYFDDCLTINRNGSAGYVFNRKGHFTINNDVTPLIIFKQYEDTLDKDYLAIVIEKITVKLFSHAKKAGKTYLKDIEISIPVKADGTFDIEVQKEIANKYEKIKRKKDILKQKQKEIQNVEISFTEGLKTKQVKITELFTLMLGDGKYTKQFCLNNQGEYPVYSGNTVGSFDSINEATYDGEYLTWSKDGLAGYIMYHNEKFSITNHRGILIPTVLCTNIDLNYIKVILEPIFRSKIKGRLGLEEKNEYTTLSKDMIKKIEDKISIPVKADGTFDIEVQKEIANKYEVIENIKTSISEKIAELTDKEIIF